MKKVKLKELLAKRANKEVVEVTPVKKVTRKKKKGDE